MGKRKFDLTDAVSAIKAKFQRGKETIQQDIKSDWERYVELAVKIGQEVAVEADIDEVHDLLVRLEINPARLKRDVEEILAALELQRGSDSVETHQTAWETFKKSSQAEIADLEKRLKAIRRDRQIVYGRLRDANDLRHRLRGYRDRHPEFFAGDHVNYRLFGT